MPMKNHMIAHCFLINIYFCSSASKLFMIFLKKKTFLYLKMDRNLMFCISFMYIYLLSPVSMSTSSVLTIMYSQHLHSSG